ncbi:MAG TPA: rhomboid family intramembrane serine protease [Chitinophagaceae bacterium]|nr:rhomboid family intramembrane serine protease [Chitinophagaceae bacterium]
MTITLALLIITCIISITAFNNRKVINDLIFSPVDVQQRHQWYRFITCGLIHADFAHLAFNMITLYFFGRVMEQVYVEYFNLPKYTYLILYIVALVVSEIPSYIKHRNNNEYRSLGASGAVAAIVFAFILIAPWATIYVFFIPVPAILYGVLFLVYSAYMSKKGKDNINHSAHLWGAVVGIVFTIIVQPAVVNIFIEKLLRPSFNF